MTVFKKSPVVYSNGLGLHIHSLLTDSPRASSSPVSSVHGRYPILSCILYITVPFLGLDTLYTKYHCVTVAHSIEYSNLLYGL